MNEDGTEHQTSKTNFQWTRLIAQFDEKVEKSFDASLIKSSQIPFQNCHFTTFKTKRKKKDCKLDQKPV